MCVDPMTYVRWSDAHDVNMISFFMLIYVLRTWDKLGRIVTASYIQILISFALQYTGPEINHGSIIWS